MSIDHEPRSLAVCGGLAEKEAELLQALREGVLGRHFCAAFGEKVDFPLRYKPDNMIIKPGYQLVGRGEP